MKKSQVLAAVILLSLLFGCSHPIEIVGNGDVLSATGTRNCYLEDFKAKKESCTKNLVIGGYQETYYAVPRLGAVFERWENYCIDTNSDECSFNIPEDEVKKNWGAAVPPLVAVFNQTINERSIVYSYNLDEDGNLIAPKPLQAEHLKRKTVYFGIIGNYSQVDFECCVVNVYDPVGQHTIFEEDKTEPFVLKVDLSTLPDDFGYAHNISATYYSPVRSGTRQDNAIASWWLQADSGLQGIWHGTQRDSTEVESNVIMLVAADATMVSFEQQFGHVFYGEYSTRSPRHGSGTLRGIAGPGYHWIANQQSVIDATAQFQQSSYDRLVYKGSLFHEGLFMSIFTVNSLQAHYDNPPTGDEVAGEYQGIIGGYNVLVSLSNAGTFSGTSSAGCIFSGKLEQQYNNKNMYETMLNVTGCQALEGSYTGKSAFLPVNGGSGKGLILVSHDNETETKAIAGWLVKSAAPLLPPQ